MSPVILAALLAAAPARAQDGSLDDLLNSIPDIQTATTPAEEPEVPDKPFTEYVDEVRAQVLAAWQPKKGSVKKNPAIETRLVLQIDAQGQVTAINAMVLSGDKKYDESCADAVNEAGPLPAPAPNLVSLAAEGVVVVFNGKAWLRGQR